MKKKSVEQEIKNIQECLIEVVDTIKDMTEMIKNVGIASDLNARRLLLLHRLNFYWIDRNMYELYGDKRGIKIAKKRLDEVRKDLIKVTKETVEWNKNYNQK